MIACLVMKYGYSGVPIIGDLMSFGILYGGMIFTTQNSSTYVAHISCLVQVFARHLVSSFLALVVLVCKIEGEH